MNIKKYWFFKKITTLFSEERGITLAEAMLCVTVISIAVTAKIKYDQAATGQEIKYLVMQLIENRKSLELFYRQYGQLPGDLPERMSPWPKRTCQPDGIALYGNGDWIISNSLSKVPTAANLASGWPIWHVETITAWCHLKLAELIKHQIITPIFVDSTKLSVSSVQKIDQENYNNSNQPIEPNQIEESKIDTIYEDDLDYPKPQLARIQSSNIGIARKPSLSAETKPSVVSESQKSNYSFAGAATLIKVPAVDKNPEKSNRGRKVFDIRESGAIQIGLHIPKVTTKIQGISKLDRGLNIVSNFGPKQALAIVLGEPILYKGLVRIRSNIGYNVIRLLTKKTGNSADNNTSELQYVGSCIAQDGTLLKQGNCVIGTYANITIDKAN